MTEPSHPWRLDTNDRYRETVTTLISLATGSLLLPVFLARDFLGVEHTTPLKDVLTSSAYLSWAFLGASIISGVLFQYFSAKWARTAWDKPVSIFFIAAKPRTVEIFLEWAFWLTAIPFIIGVAFSVYFFATVAAHS